MNRFMTLNGISFKAVIMMSNLLLQKPTNIPLGTMAQRKI